ncbi:hypothetical protein MLD38_010404 [Melastoma candidum]|uniref:Uncharacterized protein n=1 Tax=Melastoma candidum TaxID=119954 RepID=A0ACB9QZQ7_9MYRT|nr:hypothetical protein MLD38_010404 [Melastoma candidum]
MGAWPIFTHESSPILSSSNFLMGIPAALKLPKSTLVVVALYVLCAAINAVTKALQRISFRLPGRSSNQAPRAAGKGQGMWARKTAPPNESRESVRKGGMERGGRLVCAVCLGEVGEGDEVRMLRECLHSFHKGCLDGWVEEGHCTCPLCRTEFIFHREYSL